MFRIQFSHSVMSDSLRPQHTRTAACQASLSIINSRSSLKFMSTELVMLSNCFVLCHPLLLLLSVFPKSWSFPMNWFFALSGQSIGAPDLSSVPPMIIQDWFPLGLTEIFSFQSKGLSRVFSNYTVRKHQFFGAQPSLWSNSTSIHDYWKNHRFDKMDFCLQRDVSAF